MLRQRTLHQGYRLTEQGNIAREYPLYKFLNRILFPLPLPAEIEIRIDTGGLSHPFVDRQTQVGGIVFRMMHITCRHCFLGVTFPFIDRTYTVSGTLV